MLVAGICGTPKSPTICYIKVRQTTWLWFCPFHHALAATFYPRDLGSSLSLLGLQGRACLVIRASCPSSKLTMLQAVPPA